MSDKPVLIVIEGPTGVGKTEIGIELASYFHSDIISADSRQFYKELNIGTAKQSDEQLATVKHHFVNTLSVFDYYNAYLFDQDVQTFLTGYFKDADICFMVGGSGMYIDAVCNGIDLIPDIATEIRNDVSQKFKNEGIESLQRELKRIDREYYSTVDKQNPARLIRAIEVFKQTGKPYSSFRVHSKKERQYTILKIALERKREVLYERINARVHSMMKQGLESETRLWNDHRTLNALQTVGYKEFFDYFDGKADMPATINAIQQNTRRYAKKQITWFKKDIDTHWIDADNIDLMIQLIQSHC